MVESIRKKLAAAAVENSSEDNAALAETPILFLTYLNPVFRCGYDVFFQRCAKTGVDGIIIPDLPFEEHDEVKTAASRYGVDLISLIAPTSEDRIKEIAAAASGFIYLVSSMGVTGIRSEITTDLGSMTKAVRGAAKVPCAVGFGINTPEQAAAIAKTADGIIVGSALVKIVAAHPDDAGPHIASYIKEMKAAIS